VLFFKENACFLRSPKDRYKLPMKPRSHPRRYGHIGAADAETCPVYRYNRFYPPMFSEGLLRRLKLMRSCVEPISWAWAAGFAIAGAPSCRAQMQTFDVSFDEFILAYMKGKKPGSPIVGSQSNFSGVLSEWDRITHYFKYEIRFGLSPFLSNGSSEAWT